MFLHFQLRCLTSKHNPLPQITRSNKLALKGTGSPLAWSLSTAGARNVNEHYFFFFY